ncbi:MAG TPA: uroporphyrinogen decarboxylase family protein [Nevskiaceae bacterium]|nr:uroporphyrinogen decarboxylase family protein [Nevskiaceae bacterium]
MTTTPPPWRRRLADLGRGTGKPHAPLFAPLLYSVAAQIEALPPAEVTADPTRLGKCLVELRRALGTSALVVAAPTAMEAEALGAPVDRETWPPRVTAPADAGIVSLTDFDDAWSRSEALDASLETTRRLAATITGEPPFLAALTGPATLLAQLLGPDRRPDADAWEFAGRALSALSRQYAQAGVSALLLCEHAPPADVDGWTAALSTIANIARFHRIPALLAFDGAAPADWPAPIVPCVPPDQAAAATRAHGLAASADPAAWAALADHRGNARVVVTATEVPADTSIEALTDACEAALDLERE